MSEKNSVPDAEVYNYDYFFLDYVCRLCWCTEGTVELFSSKSTENEATIAEKIQECIGIDVSTHTHPKKVCSKCLKEVEIFTEFKRFCQETHRKLHDILENGTKIEKVQPIKNGAELLVLKQEPNIDFSNIEIVDSMDNLFDDIPLSSEISDNTGRRVKKERRKRSAFHCYSCHLNLECEKKLTIHNFECHGIEKNGLYKCFGCDKRFKSVKKRLRHESDSCKNLKSGYKCDICHRFLPKRRVYDLHMRAHKENKEINFADEYKCHKCKDTFTSIESLREHMQTHYQKEKKSFICDTCGRVFTRRDYLNKHTLTHSGTRLLRCPHCDYSALQKSTLNVHIRKHTGERPYPCDLCPQRCVTSSNLRYHRKRHFGDKAFQCKLCDKKFGYKLSLEEHMATSHEQSETHSCSHCGITYNRFRSLRHHLLAKHGKRIRKTKDKIIEITNCDEKQMKMTADNIPVTENDISKVTIVNKQMTLDSNQVTKANEQVTIESDQNMTLGNKELTIDIGQFAIDNPLTVGNKQVTIDNSEVTKANKQVTVGVVDKSQICGRVCKKMSMYDHMLIHTSYKQMKCPHCAYRATIRTSLNMHIKRMHSGARPFLCSRCPYRSASSCNLAAHRRTHAALSNYTCHLCNKSYRYKVSLQDHITITHEGKKRFHCLLCGSQYYLAKSLVKHLLNKHGLKVKKNKNEFIHISNEERRVVGGAII